MSLIRRTLLAWAAALLLLLPAGAAAEERILSFVSDVDVQMAGDLIVTETIRVRAEGDSIKRGILRDFPTVQRRDGRLIRTGFEVLEVRRNGKPEPWSTEGIDNGERVRIGDGDVLLDPGEHEYAIRYRTTKQLRYFPQFDELYWNVTGNGWTFPIDVGEARIRLPSSAPIGYRAIYTGYEGSTESNGEVSFEAPGRIHVRTTMPLEAGQGLTVAVAFPKGVVAAPPPRSATSLWLQRNGPIGAAALALIGIATYLFHAWRTVGRGPRRGTIVPLFSPPDGLSPAEARYIAREGAFDNRAFSAAIVSLGTKGKLRLVEGEKKLFGRGAWTLKRIGADPRGDKDLPRGEYSVMTSLFGTRDSVLVDDKNHSIFQSAKSSLQNVLEAEHGGRFVPNRQWAFAGLALMLLAVWLVALATLLTDPDLPSRASGLWVGLGVIALAGAGTYLMQRFKGGKKIGPFLGFASGLVLVFFALFLLVGMFGIASANGGFLPILAPLVALPLVISSFWWMKAPTVDGRVMMDQVAGFRKYLATTEEQRLETMHPPEKTPELFERYLPFAIALDVENAWASRFTAVLAAAAVAQTAQTMSWYSGSGNPWTDTDRFVRDIGSSLANSVGSASTPPSSSGSSSGSSGGGSSGGGGGGGGGSGW